MNIYVVEMLRWGDDETHHYIVGTFSDRKVAEEYGDANKSYRGGKYEYRVVECLLNEVDQEVVDYHKGIWK